MSLDEFVESASAAQGDDSFVNDTGASPADELKGAADIRRFFPLEQSANRVAFPENEVKNSRYTLLNFLPMNLWEQFGRPINFYFLVVAMVQFIPIIAPVNPVTMIVPLTSAFLITALKEGFDDIKRHRSDAEYNSRKFEALRLVDSRTLNVDKESRQLRHNGCWGGAVRRFFTIPAQIANSVACSLRLWVAAGERSRRQARRRRTTADTSVATKCRLAFERVALGVSLCFQRIASRLDTVNALSLDSADSNSPTNTVFQLSPETGQSLRRLRLVDLMAAVGGERLGRSPRVSSTGRLSLDQGQISACTGFGLESLLGSDQRPVVLPPWAQIPVDQGSSHEQLGPDVACDPLSQMQQPSSWQSILGGVAWTPGERPTPGPQPTGKEWAWVEVPSSKIVVGDVLRLRHDAEVPADGVVLAVPVTSGGLAFIRTENMDGEIDLKPRHTAPLAVSPAASSLAPVTLYRQSSCDPDVALEPGSLPERRRLRRAVLGLVELARQAALARRPPLPPKPLPHPSVLLASVAAIAGCRPPRSVDVGAKPITSMSLFTNAAAQLSPESSPPAFVAALVQSLVIRCPHPDPAVDYFDGSITVDTAAFVEAYYGAYAGHYYARGSGGRGAQLGGSSVAEEVSHPEFSINGRGATDTVGVPPASTWPAPFRSGASPSSLGTRGSIGSPIASATKTAASPALTALLHAALDHGGATTATAASTAVPAPATPAVAAAAPLVVPLSHEHLLLQSSFLKNTPSALLLVTHTGRETKSGMNRTAPPAKWAQVDRAVSRYAMGILLVQVCLSVVLGTVGVVTHFRDREAKWYLGIARQTARPVPMAPSAAMSVGVTTSTAHWRGAAGAVHRRAVVKPDAKARQPKSVGNNADLGHGDTAGLDTDPGAKFRLEIQRKPAGTLKMLVIFIGRFFLLTSVMIPVSFKFLVEISKYVIAMVIERDRRMLAGRTEPPVGTDDADAGGLIWNRRRRGGGRLGPPGPPGTASCDSEPELEGAPGRQQEAHPDGPAHCLSTSNAPPEFSNGAYSRSPPLSREVTLAPAAFLPPVDPTIPPPLPVHRREASVFDGRSPPRTPNISSTTVMPGDNVTRRPTPVPLNPRTPPQPVDAGPLQSLVPWDRPDDSATQRHNIGTEDEDDDEAPRLQMADPNDTIVFTETQAIGPPVALPTNGPITDVSVAGASETAPSPTLVPLVRALAVKEATGEAEMGVKVRNSGIVEDLAQVKFVMSDKTGTLTKNKMALRAIATACHRHWITGATDGIVATEDCRQVHFGGSSSSSSSTAMLGGDTPHVGIQTGIPTACVTGVTAELSAGAPTTSVTHAPGASIGGCALSIGAATGCDGSRLRPASPDVRDTMLPLSSPLIVPRPPQDPAAFSTTAAAVDMLRGGGAAAAVGQKKQESDDDDRSIPDSRLGDVHCRHRYRQAPAAQRLPDGAELPEGAPEAALRSMLLAIALCNTVEVAQETPPSPPPQTDGDYSGAASPTPGVSPVPEGSLEPVMTDRKNDTVRCEMSTRSAATPALSSHQGPTNAVSARNTGTSNDLTGDSVDGATAANSQAPSHRHLGSAARQRTDNETPGATHGDVELTQSASANGLPEQHGLPPPGLPGREAVSGAASTQLSSQSLCRIVLQPAAGFDGTSPPPGPLPPDQAPASPDEAGIRIDAEAAAAANSAAPDGASCGPDSTPSANPPSAGPNRDVGSPPAAGPASGHAAGGGGGGFSHRFMRRRPQKLEAARRPSASGSLPSSPAPQTPAGVSGSVRRLLSETRTPSPTATPTTPGGWLPRYTAASPDEEALARAAARLGAVLATRTRDTVSLSIGTATALSPSPSMPTSPAGPPAPWAINPAQQRFAPAAAGAGARGPEDASASPPRSPSGSRPRRESFSVPLYPAARAAATGVTWPASPLVTTGSGQQNPAANAGGDAGGATAADDDGASSPTESAVSFSALYPAQRAAVSAAVIPPVGLAGAGSAGEAAAAAAAAGHSSLEYRIVEVFAFTSERRAMSVLLQPAGWRDYLLLTKGGDDAVFRRLAPFPGDGAEGRGGSQAASASAALVSDGQVSTGHHPQTATAATAAAVPGNPSWHVSRFSHSPAAAETLHRDLADFASAGLRTLVFAQRVVKRQEFDAWHRRYEAAGRQVHGRAAAVAAAQLELEHSMSLLGATAVEDELQDNAALTLRRLRAGGVRVWMLTGDKVETAQQIGRSCGLVGPEDRVITIAKDPLPPPERGGGPGAAAGLQQPAGEVEDGRSWQERLLAVEVPRRIERLSELELRCRLAPRDGDRSPSPPHPAEGAGGAGVAQADGSFESSLDDALPPLRSGVFTWLGRALRCVVAWRRMEKRAAPSVPTSPVGAVYRVPSLDGSLSRGFHNGGESSSFRGREPAASGLTGPAPDGDAPPAPPLAPAGASGVELALVVQGGEVLDEILATPRLRRHFLRIALCCRAVICARAAPLQKAAVTSMVRHATGDGRRCGVVLAIGDGGNDVAMLNSAHLGVGVFGKEGTQAARAADFAIQQFSHLGPLMLFHGHVSYRRTCAIVQYSFYKSVAIAAVQVLFNAFFAANSGVSFWSSYELTMWNGAFTVAHTAALVLDRCAPRGVLMSVPELYRLPQSDYGLNLRTFAATIGRGIAHGALVVVLGVFVFSSASAVIPRRVAREAARANDKSGETVAGYLDWLFMSSSVAENTTGSDGTSKRGGGTGGEPVRGGGDGDTGGAQEGRTPIATRELRPVALTPTYSGRGGGAEWLPVTRTALFFAVLVLQFPATIVASSSVTWLNWAAMAAGFASFFVFTLAYSELPLKSSFTRLFPPILASPELWLFAPLAVVALAVPHVTTVAVGRLMLPQPIDVARRVWLRRCWAAFAKPREGAQ